MSKKENNTFHYFESSIKGRFALTFNIDMALPEVNSKEKWTYKEQKIIPLVQKTLCRKKISKIIEEINEQEYSLLNCIKIITTEK